MANLTPYVVDLDTPQPGGRSGESPRSAFTKYNDMLAEVSDYLDDGPFTPVISNLVNTSSVTPTEGSFTKVGNHVSGYFFVDATFVNGTAAFQFTLPVPASLPIRTQLGGSVGTNTGSVSRGYVNSSTSGGANTRGEVNLSVTTGGTYRVCVNYSYRIL